MDDAAMHQELEKLERASATAGRRCVGEAARQFVEEAICHTPPMMRQHTPNQGRRDWLKKIERNYKKRYYRGKWRGRKAMQSIIQEKLRRVGRMAAGWNAAASLLGAKTPGWVKRHGKKEGRVDVQETSEKFTLTVTNDVPYGKRELRRRAMSVLEGVKRGVDRMRRAIKRKILRSMR